jgi:hypothetical protein
VPQAEVQAPVVVQQRSLKVPLGQPAAVMPHTSPSVTRLQATVWVVADSLAQASDRQRWGTQL